VSKYDLFRRRIAPIAFGVVIALIAYDTCGKHERTNATIVLDFGVAEPNVRAVEAEIWMNNERVTQFRRSAIETHIGPTTFKTSLPDVDGEVRIDVELAGGEHRPIKRAIHVSEGASVTIPLERDLR
jgi:hypothetical protein